MSWQSQPYAPPNSAPPGTIYSYDALGRTVKVLLADGASATTYTYQGNFTTVTDPAGKWKQYANNALGNLVTVLEPDPLATPVPGPPATPPAYPVTAAPTGMLLTSYTYDQLNHLTQVAMPRNPGNGMYTQTRTFVYDPTTQFLTSATNPENGTVSYTYNADGTLATKHDANGNTETYNYDSYGRLIGIPDRQQTFTYDICPANAIGCGNAPGQMVQITFASNVGPNNLSFAYNYTYTAAGKVTGKTLAVQSALPASGTLAASYTYDNQGALTSMVYPASAAGLQYYAPTLTYTLDALERPIGLTDSYNNVWASGVTYNAANQSSFGGRSYNNLLQLTQVGNMTYSYPAAGNNGQIASSVDATTGETITYQYDALKRLAGASSNKNWGESYGYDGWGNLLQMNPSGTAGAPTLSVSADPATNRLAFYYDNNGNMGSGWDAANRLVSVQAGAGNATYAYDAGNYRVYARAANGVETIYFYGADGKKLASYSYAIVRGQIQFTQQSANAYFAGVQVMGEYALVSTDRLGTVGTYNGVNHRYYPYGVEYTATANDTEKYATYTRDSLTGLDYFGARYMSSAQGRFTSPDPLGGQLEDPQTLNKYTYARNNPLAFTDPTGLYVCGASMKADQCASFEQSRKDAQTAADRLKTQYGADSKKYLNAQRAIDSYGAAGVDNGVTIEVAANGGKSGVDIGSLKAKTADNPTGQNITSTFDPTSLGQGVATAGLVAHEGTHVADASDWIGSGFAAAAHPLLYTSELNAYQNQTAILQGAYLNAADRGEASGNMLTGMFKYGGNTRLLWFPGWSDANVSNAIKGWLAIPPSVGGIYGLTPASKTLMYSRPK